MHMHAADTRGQILHLHRRTLNLAADSDEAGHLFGI